MGKYMKKSKLSGEVAVIEVVGVRTRAKTLALKQLQAQSQSPEDISSLSYLQLRSRRLEKPAPVANCRGDHDRYRCRRSISVETEDDVDASCGENCLESTVRDRRTTRESTPCSLIKTTSNIVTPGSTTRRRSSATTDRRNQTDMQMNNNNPLTNEVEEFFAAAEQQQQRQFMEKYNFDIVNNLPLPGCYEWVQIF